MSNKGGIAITQEKFGAIAGTDIIQYVLKNASGMEVKIINYGGAITGIMVPDRSGKTGDVTLGCASLEGYLASDNPYLGCITGRFANRIAKGRFTLDGATYQLPLNNGPNSLHGGIDGFHRKTWKVTQEDNALSMEYLSRDGEEGYPGNCRVVVTYSLTPDNELKIGYHATTDQATPINLTNHSYFNLSAGTETTILDHAVTIHADSYLEVDNTMIPTGRSLPVEGSPMDLRNPTRIGQVIDSVPGGFDHNYIVAHRGHEELNLAAAVHHQASGRYMEVLTTNPGIQFYTGNFLNGSVNGKDDMRYLKHAGLCLETQHYPDSPNRPEFPDTILRPGETYQQTTVYRFSIR